MVHSCCVIGCVTRQSKDLNVRLHRIPAVPDRRREAWIRAIRRAPIDGRKQWLPTGSTRVCGKHFIEGKPNDDPQHPDYVPTQNMGYAGTKKRLALSRYYRKQQRAIATATREEETFAATALLCLAQGPPAPNPEIGIQTDPSTGETSAAACFDLLQNCLTLSSVVQQQQDFIVSLQEQVRCSGFGYSKIKDVDFVFHTGLTRPLFDCVATLIKNDVEIHHSKLSFNDHLLIVFVKLRLALLNKDIAFRFEVSRTTVSAILRAWIPAVARRLKPFIVWPEREVARANVPASFQPHFRKVISIIDCFEVFTERPYNLTARAQTWSNYKHNNTVKYLVSITTFGSVSFLSNGRVSDKQITLESGYMDCLTHGDEIMADRGFLIKDECAARGVTLHLPAFTKGQKQLSSKDVIRSRKLSKLRIHVERVIGKMRQFQILQSTIPLTLISLLDDMVTIIAATVNMKPSIVTR